MKIIPNHKPIETGRKLLHNDHYVEITVIFLGGGEAFGSDILYTCRPISCLQACEENGPEVRNYMFKVLEVWAYCWTLPN
jgi:hypothetical protein